MTAEDVTHVRACLGALQDAQALVNQAASELSPVPGFADEWSGLTEAYDIIKKHWHKVDQRRMKMTAKRKSAERNLGWCNKHQCTMVRCRLCGADWCLDCQPNPLVCPQCGKRPREGS